MTQSQTIDLELIAQRILTLAEVATLEHLEAVLRSQAGEMLEQALQAEQGVSKGGVV